MSEGVGGTRIVITSSTLFTKMYHDIPNPLNIDPSQYDMEMRFLFNKHSTILILSVKVTS